MDFKGFLAFRNLIRKALACLADTIHFMICVISLLVLLSMTDESDGDHFNDYIVLEGLN